MHTVIHYTVHSALYTIHSALYTLHYTSSQGAGMHTVIHYTTIHSALYSTIRSTVCSALHLAQAGIFF